MVTNHPPILHPIPTLSPLSRGTDKDTLTPLFFFVVSTVPTAAVQGGHPGRTASGQPESIRTNTTKKIVFPRFFRVEFGEEETKKEKRRKEREKRAMFFLFSFFFFLGIDSDQSEFQQMNILLSRLNSILEFKNRVEPAQHDFGGKHNQIQFFSPESATLGQLATFRCLSALPGRLRRVVLVRRSRMGKKQTSAPMTPIRPLPGDGTSAISDRGCVCLDSLTMKPRDRT